MKKSYIIGINLINLITVLTIVGVRYFYAKQEVDFLINDSDRQEQLIVTNESSIDSLSSITKKLQKGDKLKFGGITRGGFSITLNSSMFFLCQTLMLSCACRF